MFSIRTIFLNAYVQISNTIWKCLVSFNRKCYILNWKAFYLYFLTLSNWQKSLLKMQLI